MRGRETPHNLKEDSNQQPEKMWLSVVAAAIALVAVDAQPATPASTLSSFFKKLILAQAEAAGQTVPPIAQGYLDTYRVRERERRRRRRRFVDSLTTALLLGDANRRCARCSRRWRASQRRAFATTTQFKAC
jgi:hypothetical protein